jgi:extradiol dioxygenase family protein
MDTQVIMKRELFGCQISQQSKTEFFSATELVNAGNKWRIANGFKDFNLSQYLKSNSFIEFKTELEKKYGEVITSSRGRNSNTWVHPLLFIDIALSINSKLKIEVYEWLFDNLIRFRNDSGDSYKEMSAAIYTRFTNKREFPAYIQKVANYIKTELKVDDWQKATEEQLKKRDVIHNSIKLLCNVLNDTNQAVRLGVKENIKNE